MVPLKPCSLGRITYYTTYVNGACGFEDLKGTHGPGYLFGAAPNERFFNKSAKCGQCYELVGPKGAIRMMIIDLCPSDQGPCNGDMDHFDLTPQAFEAICDKEVGIVNITYRMVSCDVEGPIKIYVKPDSSQWWFSVLAYNHAVGLDTIEVQQSGSTNYEPMMRTDYNFWIITGDLKFPLKLRLKSIFGDIVTGTIPTDYKGKDFRMDGQFPIHKLDKPCCEPPDYHRNIYKNGQLYYAWSDLSWGTQVNLKSSVESPVSPTSLELVIDRWGSLQFGSTFSEPASYFSGLEFYLKTEYAQSKSLNIYDCDTESSTFADTKGSEWTHIRVEGMEKISMTKKVQKLCIRNVGKIDKMKIWIDDLHFIVGENSQSRAKCYVNTQEDGDGGELGVGGKVVISIVVSLAVVGCVIFGIWFFRREGKEEKMIEM